MAYFLLYDPLDTLFKPQRAGVKASAGDTILAILLGLLGSKFICQLLSKSFILAFASEGLFSTCMCFLAPASPSAQIHPSEAQPVGTFHIKWVNYPFYCGRESSPNGRALF
jgi:hypothetical protein